MEERSFWFWIFMIPVSIGLLYVRHVVISGKRLYTKCPSCKETEPQLEEGIQNCSNCGYQFEVDNRGSGTHINAKPSLGLSVFLLLAAIITSYQIFIPDNDYFPYHEDSTLTSILNISVVFLLYGLTIYSFIKYFKENK